MNVTSPVSGAAQTGHSAPTFTVVADIPPNAQSRQYAVTANGGTQPFTDTHSASKPFTTTVSRPAILRQPPVPNPVTGVVGNSPKNNYGILTRKGTLPLTGQSPQVSTIRTELGIVAGADVADADAVRAMISAHIGVLTQLAAGIGDTAVSGIL
jgi:hypothetical protein